MSYNQLIHASIWLDQGEKGEFSSITKAHLNLSDIEYIKLKTEPDTERTAIEESLAIVCSPLWKSR